MIWVIYSKLVKVECSFEFAEIVIVIIGRGADACRSANPGQNVSSSTCSHVYKPPEFLQHHCSSSPGSDVLCEAAAADLRHVLQSPH